MAVRQVTVQEQYILKSTYEFWYYFVDKCVVQYNVLFYREITLQMDLEVKTKYLSLRELGQILRVISELFPSCK